MASFNYEVTAEYLRKICTYSKRTGVLKWKKAGPERRESLVIGCLHPAGYLVTAIRRRHYRVHRLIWLYVTGAWPKQHIDHKDGNRSNNKWKNIRDATPSLNGANQRLSKNNKTGFKGVYARKNLFVAQITARGEHHYLGTFAKAEEAHNAYRQAAIKLFGEYARY